MDQLTPYRLTRLKHVRRNRDHTSGSNAVKDAGTLYLPRKSNQSQEAYEEYLATTSYFPAASRTLQSFVGLVFRKNAAFTAPLPIVEMSNAIGAHGETLEEIARWCLAEYLIANDGGLLVDHPDMPEGLTLAQAIAGDYRPFLAHYRAEHVIDLCHSVIGGRKRLTYVQLLDDENHARVLELKNGIYTVTQMEKNAGGEWFEVSISTPLKNGQPFYQIPFIPLTDNENGAPLDDLVAMNQVHYRHSARHNLAQMWLSKPQPWIAGVKEDVALDVCEGTIWRFEDPTAKAEYLEYRGDGIPSIERTLDRIEKQMAELGLRILSAEKAAAEAVEVVLRRQASENSVLAAVARHVSARVQEALEIMAAWAGFDPSTVTYMLNCDFVPRAMDPQLLQQLAALNMSGKLTDREFFDALKRFEVIEDTVDFEARQGELDAQEIDQPLTLVTPPPVAGL